MGRVGQQSPRQVLQADGRGTPRPQRRIRRLGSSLGGRYAGNENGMNWEWWSILRQRIKGLILRRQLDRDLEEEIAFHLEKRGEAARVRFGNPTVYKENMREMWTIRWIEILGQDLRYAARTLRSE